MPENLGSVVNGELASNVPVSDRGLQYGDGVFRTILIQDDHWLDEDLQFKILQRDAERLALTCPDPDTWKHAFSLFHVTEGFHVVKCLLTRGSSGRGYAIPDQEPRHNWILSLHAAPRYPEGNWQQGVHCIITRQQWGTQPVLAGIKHLNRLEQVLAHTEVMREAGIQEGLVCDQEGTVISGCMSNLFLVKDGKLLSPSLKKCGVAGMMREKIITLAMRHEIEIAEQVVSMNDLKHADEVFLCNSLIGIWPVRKIQDQLREVGPMTRDLQQKLNHPHLVA